MVFSSNFFLFVFLPIVLVMYHLLPGIRIKNSVLLLSSLFFYAWGEGVYLWVMLVSIIIGWLFALLIETCASKRLFLSLGVFCALALLGYFKYFNFLAENLLRIFGLAHIFTQTAPTQTASTQIVLSPIHLPIGISFFTFQIISYLIDVYRGTVSAQRNVFKVGLYKTFFPQLIAGPIVRYVDIKEQISSRICTGALFCEGIRRFSIGLGKKILIANAMGEVADKVFALPAAELSPLLANLGAVAYFLQIYYDFSGYSDMAIGLGKMFGFTFKENFAHPYSARSITDFWRRWHISLSSWFRDYLYIPLGGNRCAPWRQYLNLMTVFLLCGLWHGAAWTFVVWGVYHGMLLIIEKKLASARFAAVPYFLKNLYTLVLVVIGWVFFRASSLSEALNFLQTMAGFSGKAAYFTDLHDFISTDKVLFLACGLFFMYPVTQPIESKQENQSALWAVHASWALVLLILAIIYLSETTYNPFIYYRF